MSAHFDRERRIARDKSPQPTSRKRRIICRMASSSRLTRTTFSMLVVALPMFAACGLGEVRYQGNAFDRPLVPLTSFEVIQTGTPNSPSKDLGIVTVICPTQDEINMFGTPGMAPGCSYERAVWLASAKAAGVGASGIHSIQTSKNNIGAIMTLRATAFEYGPKHDLRKEGAPRSASQPASEPAMTVEQRLKRLEKLRDDGVITPEEHDAKRADILKEL